MSKAKEEPEGVEHLGILGRAMARARARSLGDEGERDSEPDATPGSHDPRKRRDLDEPAAREFAGVVVGADGVLFQGGFIPHSSIRDVRLNSKQQRGSGQGDTAEGQAVSWSVSLGLVGTDVIKLTRDLETGRGAGAVHYLAYEIESAHKAWRAAQQTSPLDVPMLARGEQTARDWLKSLRRLGSGAGPYRAPLVDIEQISHLLDDARAKPWARAAAAVVLAASGDATAADRLRASAASMANPRTREALDTVAAARDDDAVADALETLGTVEGEGCIR